MTLLEIERLTRRISEVLQPGGSLDFAPRLAEDFAAACHAANLRLQQCEAMIRANDRLQAIQLAETAPNLIDLITLLEFRNAADWRGFCQKNALPVAERIDARAVQSLNQCYAQGINTDHPLYAAFRKATLTRNDEDALKALRSITRLNPADANAASELARVDAKVLTMRLDQLSIVLASGDAALVVAEVEGIESSGFKTRLGGEVWRQAALVRCGVLLTEATQSKAASQWATTLAKIELARRLQKELGLELSAAELKQLDELEKWTRGEQEKDRQNREFNRLLSDLQRHIHESEEKDTSARFVELPELRADYEAMHKVWRAVADFTRPIPEDASAAFRKRSTLLEGEIARRMAVRRRIIFATAAAVFLVGALIVWIVLGQMRAHQFARELEGAVSKQQTRVAERLLETARTTGKRMLSIGAVSVAVADAESFVAKEHSLLDNFEGAFAKLPKQLSSEHDTQRVKIIAQQLAATRAALNGLAPDLKAENELRVSAFERQWQQFLSEAAEGLSYILSKWVTTAERESARLDYRSSTGTAPQLVELTDTLQKINEFESQFTNDVALRSELLQRAEAVQAKYNVYEGEWKKLDGGLMALHQAHAFSDFSSAINSMASSEFSSAPATVAAHDIQLLNTSEEVVLRSLMNATNSATWAFIKKAKSSNLIPEIALPVERSLFAELNADPAVNANHQRYRFWLDAGKTTSLEWITAGVLDGSVGWKKIKAWEVAMDATNAVFDDHDYGYFNGQWKLSRTQPVFELGQTSDLKETAAFAAADLAKVWSGGNTYAQPLLKALDAVKDSDEGSPIFRAYLLCRLMKLMEFQPDEWGLSFCPSAKAHMAQIRNIVGGEISSGDWFVPAKKNAWDAKLEQFFAAAKSVSYMKQAAGNLALAQAAAKDGLLYIGFADLDGKPIMASTQTHAAVWGYDAASKKPALVAASAMPLSPLFTLSVPRMEYLATAGVDPASPSFANGGLLPLFRIEN